MKWYQSELQEDVVWESVDPKEEEMVKARIAQRIYAEINIRPTQVSRWHWQWSVAAVAAALVGVLFWFNVLQNDQDIPAFDQDIPTLSHSHKARRAIVDLQQEAEGNRFVLLPDSSKVVLRPGSKLEYTTDFRGKTREVTLVGEGYFDIARDENRPFIVHSGGIRTVVLGTAFTVKAAEGHDEVQVTVQHGRVRVENDREILAELVANQQLEVDVERAVTVQKMVLAEETSAWTAEGMRFDDEAFGSLVDRLQKRYDVEIAFVNPGLASCPVSGQFTGAETLDTVLELLCATRNATFVKAKTGRIEISGPGCEREF
jgi:ferric-dicitrate binding protein FerR (iron transport regulator)